MTIHDIDDIDSRGRQAAAAAHASVALLVRAGAGPRQWLRTPPRRQARGRAIVAAALAVLVPLLVLGALRFTTSTKVSTGASPAAQSSSTLPTPPAPRHPAGAVQGVSLASGTASDGRAWVLFVGGPAGGICLGIEIGDGATRSDTCAANTGPAGPDPYRPWFHNDTRTRPFVFGRVADDIVAVAVEEPATDPVESVPVIRGPAGSFYVVELPHRKKPGAVTGLRNDGTSVRYPVP